MALRVAAVIGTRPEAIKMCPVIHALNSCSDMVKCQLILTGQHRDLVAPILECFGIEAAADLQIMKSLQTLPELTASVLKKIQRLYDQSAPDLVLVQGDTTSAFAAALAAFYSGIPVAHVEAGLRTGKINSPFPEEANRKLIAAVSTLHFAPTPQARENLLREGIRDSQICVSGNTVVDALYWIRQQATCLTPRLEKFLAQFENVIVVTMHRRENWGEPLARVCGALKRLLRKQSGLGVVFPVHLNPIVRKTVFRELGSTPQICLCDPLPYPQFVQVMEQADLILTDSGGIQEEAPYLAKRVLVLREETERPESLACGAASVIGTNELAICRSASRLLHSKGQPASGGRPYNEGPYGDGQASLRIVEFIAQFYGLSEAVRSQSCRGR